VRVREVSCAATNMTSLETREGSQGVEESGDVDYEALGLHKHPLVRSLLAVHTRFAIGTAPPTNIDSTI